MVVCSENLVFGQPHQDYKINLAGTIIDQLKSNDILYSVIFITNEDFFPYRFERRMEETAAVTQAMGFSNVYFLGYPDGVEFDGRRFYEYVEGDNFESSTGKKDISN